MKVELNLSPEEYDALLQSSRKDGRSPEEVARLAVNDYTTGWRRERELLVDAIVAEDAGLLERLGTS